MKSSTPLDLDRISDLPNHILYHILSLLPTKLAFSTTILSKRWTSLYKSLTVLHFIDEQSIDKHSFFHFLHFVDRVTLSTEQIKTFHLNCTSAHHTTSVNFNHWNEILKRHPVESLHLSCAFRFIILPPSIFTFSSLVVLKLKTAKVVGDISVDLPLLKILHLDMVYFNNHQIFIKLLSGCPVLEDLHTRIFYEELKQTVSVCSKGVKTFSKLIRASINAFDVPFKVVHNVKFLKLKMENELSYPQINSFYRGFPVFGNLIHLEVCVNNFLHWGRVVELLQYCPKLQILDIDKLVAVNTFFFINWECPNFVPECISSHLRSCTVNYEGWKEELQFTTYILQNARRLEVMKIIISDILNPNSNQHALEELSLCPRISPECELSIGFRGNEDHHL